MFDWHDGERGGGAHGEETRDRVLLRVPLVEADVRDCRAHPPPPNRPPSRRLMDGSASCRSGANSKLEA